jgi:predicted  nucleic acid-binding Zn-ribbon protein
MIDRLTNLEKEINNIAQVISEIREDLKDLKRSKETQQPNQSFLMVSIF